jgi:ABC-type phosphate/phosphonate transport system substrate-binding protein
VTDLVTSLRMYSATPSLAAAWRQLFERAFAAAGVRVRFITHGFPQPIEALWSEPMLCADFMCGWPFVRSVRGMQPIAVPVPAPPPYRGLSRYRSEFLVRAASGWGLLEQTFGHRIGWMAEDSQSGFNAPRALLARHATSRRAALYARSVGPFVTPARTLEALQSDKVDVAAIDGFYLDLVRHADPAALAGIRTIAATPWTPMPLLVAGPGVDARVVAALRSRFVALHIDPACRPLLASVLLKRFDVPDVTRYAALVAMERRAVRRGYASIR